MEAESILLGATVPIILGLMGLVGIMWRGRNHRNGNPNLATVDEKLNQILLALTEIKVVLQNCPVVRERRS